MAELPYMQIFVGDYLMDTRHLSTEEHGAYLLLMFEYWTNGEALRDDDKRLAKIAGVSPKKWRNMRPALEEFFSVDGRTWAHKRIEMDLRRVREKVEKAKKAGRASANARSNGRSNVRSTSVQRPHQRKGELYQNHNKPPYPLTEAGHEDAPAPSGGRASSASDGAESIGSLIQGKVPRKTKGRQ